MRLVEFMQRIGRLKRAPASWKDVFLPEAHDLSGN
jgi:NitT/TauT family transport system substrate-binding protein